MNVIGATLDPYAIDNSGTVSTCFIDNGGSLLEWPVLIAISIQGKTKDKDKTQSPT
jgi:hypothetical protein